MKRQLTCIACPRGCALQVVLGDESIRVEGNACPRGAQYGIEECTHPTRIVTSVIRISNRKDTMVSVKTETPLPKEHIVGLMQLLRQKEIAAPVHIGDVICEDAFGTRVIATKQIL